VQEKVNNYLTLNNQMLLCMKLSGENRSQLQMMCLEEIVAKDSYVRVVDAFVDYLNLSKLGFKEKGNSKEGRPAFPSESLLKLYYYGYLNRVRSSRRLEREAKTNMEAIWLMKGLKPCYKTIADFRKINGRALKKSFQQLNRFLKSEGLLSDFVVAVDGSKFRGQNSKKNNYNEKKVKDHLGYIDRQVDKYIAELELLDNEEKEEDGSIENRQTIANSLEQLKDRRQKYEVLDEQIKEAHTKGITQISTTDPDARALPKRMNVVEVGYNIVMSTERENKLITNYETTNEHDTYALSKSARKAKVVLGVGKDERLKVLADKGFDTGLELMKCSKNNIETIVSPKKRLYAKKEEAFSKSKFAYESSSDSYICPQGEHLVSNGKKYERNKGKLRKSYKVKHYKLPFSVCNNCVNRLECAGAANLKNSKGRYIERTEYDDYIDDNVDRVKYYKELYKNRQAIVEHPFGTIKRGWGYDYTLLKTKKKVSGEFGIIFTVYNLRRMITIFGVQELIKRLSRSISFKILSYLACIEGFWENKIAKRKVVLLKI